MSPNRLRLVALLCCALIAPFAAFGQFRTPTYGWNLGDTMEAPSGVGTWFPAPTQALIDAVARAGFNTVRIPCAWDSNADPSTYQIHAAFMAQVKQVVDWCLADNLTVVINDHWDDGWFEASNFDSVDPTVKAKLISYWTQIATTFAGYDHRLLFACANEPQAKTAAQTAVLFQYYQYFVNTVRATGGQNVSRWLVLQGPTTNIDNTCSWVTALPTDPTPGRLVLEVHYYDPYNFTIMSQDASWGKMSYFWGSGYHSTVLPDRNATWGEEAAMKTEFAKMNATFVSKGIPVMIGEFAASDRTGNPELTGDLLTLHLASRTYFDQCVIHYAQQYGLAPFYWDTGLFDRHTAALIDPASARALTGGVPLLPSGAPMPHETVAAGGTAAFSVPAASGTTYQWELNGIAIPNATDPTLFISDATTADQGTYACVATGTSGTTATVVGMLTVGGVSPGYLVNLSARGFVGSTADDNLIVGFYTTGQPKSYLIRGVGPTLANFGITDPLRSPLLTLIGSNQTVLATNAGWQGDPLLRQAFQATGAFALPADSADTAMLQTLGGGVGYSAQVSSPTGATGVSIAEIYDDATAAAPGQRLINVSSRALVKTDADILVDGFVISGSGDETVLIRAVGPTLTNFGVTGALQQPQITLFKVNGDGTNTVIASNSGWNGDATLAAVFHRVGAFSLPDNPASADAALLVTLPPGGYTAQVTGANGTTGVALAEVYEVR